MWLNWLHGNWEVGPEQQLALTNRAGAQWRHFHSNAHSMGVWCTVHEKATDFDFECVKYVSGCLANQHTFLAYKQVQLSHYHINAPFDHSYCLWWPLSITTTRLWASMQVTLLALLTAYWSSCLRYSWFAPRWCVNGTIIICHLPQL